MSPVKIILLLNIFTSSRPMEDYKPPHRDSPAMRQAVEDFVRSGILKPDVTHASLCFEGGLDLLTDKGKDLAERLKLVEPKDSPKVSFAKLEKAAQVLRDEHRLKLGTDFSYIVKYNELRIFCTLFYKFTIEEVMDHYEIPVTSFITY